jgi:DNA-binding CsgD family transcriptional regulator
MARSLADRASAAVALDSGETVSAAGLALASASAADEVGVPIEAALSRLLAGRALARAGQMSRAVAEFERAADELHACGAVRSRDQAESELRRLGHRVHRRTLPGKADGLGLASLTGRELQVARLVADLKTNPQIAAALFLSHRTVESHVRNIFRKLGVSSRAQIARAVERAEPRSPP